MDVRRVLFRSASSISLVKRPLPPISDSARSWMRSPVVLMTTMATACSAASSGCAAARRRRTSPAWASASGEPRVPRRRSGFAVMALALDHGPSDENRSPAPRSQSRPGGVRSGAMTRPAETMIVAPRLTVLGIETSCDETAAAVVSGSGEIRANLVLSQLDEHRPYGGVVPEIAARSHLDHIDRLIAEAMQQAGLEFAELDGIAATAGPGLIGGVLDRKSTRLNSSH